MMRLYSPARASKILGRHAAWIQTVSQRYGIPQALIKAILFQEMTMIDLMDPLADLAVRTGIFKKKDSSTGYGQVFGRTGVIAVNYAVDHGLETYESLGVCTDHRLDEENLQDVRLVWRLLNGNPEANIQICALNLLVAADEVVGRTDFESFSDEEYKLVCTRYNANRRQVTPYGERAFRRFRAFQRAE